MQQYALIHKPTGQVVLIFNGPPKPGEYEPVRVIQPTVPPGQREAGRPEYIYNRAIGVVEKYVHTEDKVFPPSSSAKLDRLLNIAGLTLDEVKAVLGVTAHQAIMGALLEEITPGKPDLAKRLQDRAIGIVTGHALNPHQT